MGSGRPPTDLGTWGSIHTFRVRDGAYRARTRIRDADGMTRQVTATGTTKAAADRALRAKLAERKAPTEQSITAEDRKEHTSELQSLMRISYAVFCLKKKTPK